MSADRLLQVAAEIKNEQSGLVEAVRHSLAHARRIGELLAEVKSLKPKGGIDKWMAANCQFSVRMGYNYLSIFKQWGKIEASLQDISDLTLSQAIKMCGRATKRKAVQAQENTEAVVQPAPTILPLRPEPNNDDFLVERMKAHGISGTVAGLRALLAELGVSLVKSEAA